jgi:tetratricopeptide (TPR) repeat protein
MASADPTNLELNLTPDKPALGQAYTALRQDRRWLWPAFGLSGLALLAWGLVILPESNPLAWLWWPVSLGTWAGAGWLLWRQTRQAGRETGQAEAIPEAARQAWWQKVPLGLALLLGLGLLVNLFILVKYPQLLRYDSYEYSRIAFQYSQQGYTPDAIRPPGYTLLIAAIYKIVGGPQPQLDRVFGPPLPPATLMYFVWVFQAVLLSLTALVVYGLLVELTPGVQKRLTTGRIYWGRRLSLFGAGLVAFCPFLIAYTSLTLTEIAAAFWLTASVFCWVKFLKYPRLWVYGWLAGVAMAWLLQTRPTFIYLPILAVLTLAWFGRGRRRLWSPLALALPLLLFLWPQTLANWETWGEPAPVIAADLSTYQTAVGIYYVTYGGLPRYQTIASAASPAPTEEPVWERLSGYLPLEQGQLNGQTLTKEQRLAAVKVERAYFKQFFADYVLSNPLQFAGTAGQRLWFMWDQHYVFPYYDPGYFDYRWLTDNLNRLYLIFGLVGFGAAWWRWGKLALPLWLSILYLVGVNALVRIEFRYTLPAYPLLLAFAALGVWEVVRAVRGRATGQRRVYTLAGAGLALLLVAGLSALLPLIPPTNPQRERALDVKAQADELNDVRQFWAAEPLYNQAIALDPSESQLWSSRGNFFAGTGDYAKALPDYNKALQLDPTAGDVYRWRGQTEEKLGQNQAARADFEKFLQLAPSNHPRRSKIEQEVKVLGVKTARDR